jgi:pimeloyl-ACP methyl ester carboxylesterase
VPGKGWPSPQWHAEHTIVDGIRWFARISPGGDVSRPPVVLLHGLVVSGAYFQPVAARLAETLSLFVPDVPGFGHSANPQGWRNRPGVWDIVTTADGLARWLDAHDLRGTVLVANSLGCQVATLLACRRPELVARLVLIGPTMDPAARSIPAQLWRGLRDIPHESPALWSIWIPDGLRAGPWRGLRTLHFGLQDDVASPPPRRHPANARRWRRARPDRPAHVGRDRGTSPASWPCHHHPGGTARYQLQRPRRSGSYHSGVRRG